MGKYTLNIKEEKMQNRDMKKELGFDSDMLLVAVDNVVNGLSEFGLDFELFIKLSDYLTNGWYDLAYDLVCDLDTKMNDSDRLSLKYLLYHAKLDYADADVTI